MNTDERVVLECVLYMDVQLLHYGRREFFREIRQASSRGHLIRQRPDYIAPLLYLTRSGQKPRQLSDPPRPIPRSYGFSGSYQAHETHDLLGQNGPEV